MQFMEPVPTQGPIPRMAGLPSPFPTKHLRALVSLAWQHPHTPLQQTILCLLWTEHLIFERSCRLPVSRSARCRLPIHIRLLSVSSRANMHYLRLSIRPLLGTWALWSTHLQWVQLQAIIATVTWLQCLILWLMRHMEHNHAFPLFFFFCFFLFIFSFFWLYWSSRITYWLAFVIVLVIFFSWKVHPFALFSSASDPFWAFPDYNFSMLVIPSKQATALGHTLILSVYLSWAFLILLWRSADTYWCDDFTSLLFLHLHLFLHVLMPRICFVAFVPS